MQDPTQTTPMTAREKLHDIVDHGTDKQLNALITLLLLERPAESSPSETPAKKKVVEMITNANSEEMEVIQDTIITFLTRKGETLP